MKRLTTLIAFAGLCFASALSAKEESQSFSSVLAEDGRFTSLLAALEAADLVGTLQSSESVTALAANGTIHSIDTFLIPSPEVLEISSSTLRKGNIEIGWNANRVGPYKLQRTTTLADPECWEDVVVTRDKSAKVSTDGSEAYFRVVR